MGRQKNGQMDRQKFMDLWMGGQIDRLTELVQLCYGDRYMSQRIDVMLRRQIDK